MELGEWRKWWEADGFARLRGLLNDEWDPIPGSPPDEYDDVVLQLGRRLRERASEDEIAAFLRDTEIDLVGVAQPANSRRAARLVRTWYANETGEPLVSRDDALRWAKEEAQRILDGRYPGPVGIFNAAQRIEHALTAFRWMDQDFPRAAADFVFGWNVSGPEADKAIREAARDLVSDPWFGQQAGRR